MQKHRPHIREKQGARTSQKVAPVPSRKIPGPESCPEKYQKNQFFAFDLACKKEAAHRAGGTDDAQHAEEGGRVLIGGHFFLVPKGQDNGRVEIQVNLKFSKMERKI